MKPRDIILKTIEGTSKDYFSRRPVTLLSGGTWTFGQRRLSLRDILDDPGPAAGIITGINQEVRSDIIWPGSGYHNLLVQVFGGKIKFRPYGNIDVMEPAFATLGEAEKADFSLIDQDIWIRTIRGIITDVNRLAGEEYLIGTSSWGPFTLAGQFYGVEKVMSGLYKDKQGIHALLEVMTEVACRYLAPTVAAGAKLLSIAEPTASGDLISRSHFDEFVAPYLAKLFARLKAEGALITLHICGNIQDRLVLAPDIGVDLLSVDYKVDLAEAAKVLDGKVALAGNVNPVILRDSSPDEVRAATRSCLDSIEYDRFILMPGCDIPPAAPLANIKAFIDAGLGG